MSKIMRKLAKQLFKKPFTNEFPAKYAPDSVLKLFDLVESGEAELNPTVETPPGLRGKISYDTDECIKCYQCKKVCPADVMQIDEDQDGYLVFYITRCTFCSQCEDMCPVDAIELTDEFLLADGDKYSENLVVNSEKSPGELNIRETED